MLLGARLCDRGREAWKKKSKFGVHVVQVSARDFQQLAALRQALHKLGAALDFYTSITSSIGRADFQRAVAVVMGQPLAEHVVRRRLLRLLDTPSVTKFPHPQAHAYAQNDMRRL